MTPEDLDKLISDPKTWVVKDFNHTNVYLHLDEINLLIDGLYMLIEQEEFKNCSADFANNLIEKLSTLEEKERSRN